MENSSKYRVSFKNALYLLCWRWMKKKHPRSNKRYLALKYFLQANTHNSIEDKSAYPEEAYLKLKNRTWVFRGETETENRYRSSAKGRTTFLQDPTNVAPIVTARTYQLPNKLRHIHAFHADIDQIQQHKLKVSLIESSKTPTLKDELYTLQKGLCSLCHRAIKHETLHDKTCHIHHINPISKGGSKFNKNNLTLTHA